MGLASLLACSGFAQEAEVPVEKPNLLFIFTDDQRSDAIGYANPIVHTPNLDKLSAEGLRFEDAFITLPVCSSARATALTGRYTKANGVTIYQNPLHASEESFADYLDKAGYLTAMVGKWHVSGRGPKDLGFQQVYQLAGNAPYWNPSYIENGKRRKYAGYSTDFCVDKTIEVMKMAGEGKKPFAIWLCTQAPHHRGKAKGGSWLSKETEAIYADGRLSMLPVPPNIHDNLRDKPPYMKNYRARRSVMRKGPMTDERYRDNKDYFGQVTEMDRSLGKLFGALEKMNLRRNTYIFFMSDNGLFLGEFGLMSKALHYEPAIRVPMFVVGPGIRSGWDDENMVTNADIAPTLLDLAGVTIPANMHGKSLKNLLLEGKSLNRSYLLFELPDAYEKLLETRAAYSIRSDRWKYIQTFEDGNDQPYTFEELYDLQEDPYEMNNLAGDLAKQTLISQLRSEMTSERERTRQ